MNESVIAGAKDTDERLRRIALIIRQGLYFVADELGKEFGLSRPCKVCEQRGQRSLQSTEKKQAA